MVLRHPGIALALVAGLAALPLSVHAQADRLVVLVRHAEAGGEPRADPPLTDRGYDRARALAHALAAADIGAVIVSDRARTRLTGEPLATDRGITPIVVGVAGGLDEHVAAVADAVRGVPAGVAVLVVGHSNTVPAIMAALGGPPMADLCHGEFSLLFVLVLAGDGAARLVKGSYGLPDEAGAAECH